MVLYQEMLSRSWTTTLPSSTRLTTELILLYLTQSYVFSQQPETKKVLRMRSEHLPVVLYLTMLSIMVYNFAKIHCYANTRAHFIISNTIICLLLTTGNKEGTAHAQ